MKRNRTLLSIINLWLISLVLPIISLNGATSKKSSIRVWTYEQIERLGLRQKCQEVENLKSEGLVTKADRVWKIFVQSNADLFAKNSRSPTIFLKLPGQWKATIDRSNGYSTQAKISCSKEDNPSCQGEHFEYEYDSDRSFPLHIREKFEEAAHGGHSLDNVQIAPADYSSMFDLVRCEIKAQIGYGNPTLYSFSVTNKKISTGEATLPSDESNISIVKECLKRAASAYESSKDSHKKALQNASLLEGKDKEDAVKVANDNLTEASKLNAAVEIECKKLASTPGLSK